MRKLLVSLLFIFVVGCSQVETRCPVASEDEIGQIKSIDYHREQLNKNKVQYKDAVEKLQRQIEILSDYERHQQAYGKQGLDLPGHTQANIKYYKEEIQKAESMIAHHQSMIHKFAGM